MKKDIFSQTAQDLLEDFIQLEYLTTSLLSNLIRLNKEINNLKKIIRPDTIKLTQENLNHFSLQINSYYKDIQNLKRDASRLDPSLIVMEKLIYEKEKYFDLIRTEMDIIGSLMTSLDYQSPSFDHTIYSMAGCQAGKIRGTINDYKRDSHLDEEVFEKSYLKEYIDALVKFRLKSLMTSSGMSAFTTVFNYLLMEKKLTGNILLGKSSYFQYKHILVNNIKEKITEFDEMDSKRLIAQIKQLKPDAIFLDSLCNAKNIPVPNLCQIIKYLKDEYKKEIYLIIDNTCLSVFCQPFKMLGLKKKNIRLITFESLMKYLHFGLDRVTAGMITAEISDAVKLYECRKHLGTNIADCHVYAFPPPNRIYLEKRLKRHQRNAFFLASNLQKMINKKTNLNKIVYPGLKNHPSYFWIKDSPFQGSFFNLEFRNKKVRIYQKFIKQLMLKARKKRINLIAGTSFGLNTTRVYLTSLWTKFGQPFARISLGTETRLELERLYHLFKEVIKEF